MAATPCFALIGDMVESRAVADRVSLSERLEALLLTINKGFADEYLAPLITTRGVDEVSGALHRPDRAFEIAVRINEALWPIGFRWAIGCGEIDVGRDSGDAAAMDGPAFHAASAAMARARDDKLAFAIGSIGVPATQTRLTEAAANLHARLMEHWTPLAARAVAGYRRLGTQAKTAEELGVSVQAVSKALRRASFREMNAFERSLTDWLTEWQ